MQNVSLSSLAFDKLHAVARLCYCNPFTEERIAWEKQALGKAYRHAELPWNVQANVRENPNTEAIVSETTVQLEHLRDALAKGERLPGEHAAAVRDAALFCLYHRWIDAFREYTAGRKPRRAMAFAAFTREATVAFAPLPPALHDHRLQPAHLYACFFQIWRAYTHISDYLIGSSSAIMALRARIWQSIFTHDMERYQRCLYERLGDVTTLITGPSGSGKELVARAIGLSRFIPFDDNNEAFAEDYRQRFYPLNLSALSPTLIESELFGHRRSAFTGALQDHAGYLEQSGPYGAVFLDEIGETSHDIQVKLLRVLQTRGFQRLGDTELRSFSGKVIAATNRELPQEIKHGNFREDLYYRLCADRITTPPLADIIDGSEQQLRQLIWHIAGRLVGETGNATAETDLLAQEASQYIQQQLGLHYRWPGNFRELEQAMRNILVHGGYEPAVLAGDGQDNNLARQIESGSLNAHELLSLYAARLYQREPSYEAVARQLELDRRTVKKYVTGGQVIEKSYLK